MERIKNTTRNKTTKIKRIIRLKSSVHVPYHGNLWDLLYYSRNENEIELENQQRYYSDNESMQMSVKIDNVNNGTYIIKTFSVSQTNGNVQNEWKELDYFNDLSLQEVDYLKKWCQPKLTIRKVEAVNHTLIVETRIAAQEIQGIVVGEL